jgi:hypothetical protein
MPHRTGSPVTQRIARGVVHRFILFLVELWIVWLRIVDEAVALAFIAGLEGVTARPAAHAALSHG